jgi:hypothetical protein
MKKIVFLSMLFSLITFGSISQNQTDAFRYSQIIYGGTARSTAMGNAFGSLGADFSSLTINPAGIGLYKKSEFSITPSIYIGSTSSDYLNKVGNDLKYNFNLNSAGLVISFNAREGVKSAGWKGVQFGLGFNRLNNYNNRVLIEGTNDKNSIVDDFLQKANGVQPQDLNSYDALLAFNTYLIDTSGGKTKYKSIAPFGGVTQSKSIETYGSMNEFLLTFGGNYNDRIYIGATVGFPFLRYFENSIYREKADTIPNYKNMTYRQNLETHGYGFNFGIGVIYRIADWVRIGGAFHTPTFFSMNDKWRNSIESNVYGTDYSSSSPNGRFNYQLNTPLRAIGSLSFIIGKYALISADYEYLDYGTARLRSSDYDFFDENSAIRNDYAQQHNIRAGFEVKFDPISIRGGYILNMNPYKSDINDGTRNSFSGGIGLRTKYFYFDIAYVYSQIVEDYYLYSSVPTPSVNKSVFNNILATVGVKF